MAELSRSDVEHVAYLARLGLRDAELDTESIPPTAQTIELENILREDVAIPSLPVPAVVGNAPVRQDDFIVVPPILGDAR